MLSFVNGRQQTRPASLLTPAVMPITLDDLRRFAVGRSLFAPTTLKRALHRLGFVQADPIRAPARAQDLTLRHRVRNYHAGDLERRYQTLDVAEDVFVNYGYVTTSVQELMHPRLDAWPAARARQAQLLLAFVLERGAVHPREVNDHFSRGKVKNYWGGSSNATTQLLEAMHYRGLLRVARRERGIRIYEAYGEAYREAYQRGPVLLDAAARQERIDALVDVAVRLYAPLPGASLSVLVRRLRLAARQWRGALTSALKRARQRLSQVRLDGVTWYWPADEAADLHAPRQTVRLLAPFDPVVWDRARFELLWGWTYRFEAYTPEPKRKRGYYALPLLWRDRVIGWGNLSVKNGELASDFGYVQSPPRDRIFRRELDMEIDRIRAFLHLQP